MKRHSLPILLIVVISLTLYANTLKNGFVYDDEYTIANNTLIKDTRNLPKLFIKEDYFALSEEQSYRPVVTLTYFIDYALYGLKPWGFHLTNILLHATNGTLLYIFLTLISKPSSVNDKQQSVLNNLFANKIFLVSLLFATHPVLTEAVNAVSFREDLLAFLFYMSTLTLYVYLRSESLASRMSSYLLYAVSCLLYSLALFSKEMAVTLPLIIFMYEWIHAEKHRLRFSLSNGYFIGLVFIAFIYLLLRFTYLYNPLESSILSQKLSDRLYSIPMILLNYLKLIFYPVSLSVVHDLKPVSSPSSPIFLVPVVTIVLLFIVVFRAAKKETSIVFGASFLFLTLLPVYNIIPITIPFAERYLYLPMAGFAIMIGGFINLTHRTQKILNFRDSKLRSIPWLISLTAILSINSLTVVGRNHVWRDNKSLWTDAAKKSPESPRAHNSLGAVYYESGNLKEAINEYNLAIKIKPEFPVAHANIGIAYLSMGQIDNSLHHLKEAVRLNPRKPEFHLDLGRVYRRLGRPYDAIPHYTAAAKLNPRDSTTYHILGLLYSEIGKTEVAIEHFKTAIELAPFNISLRNDLANLYFSMRKYDKAIDECRNILNINPNDASAHNDIGLAYTEEGRFDDAVKEFKIALQLRPFEPIFYNNLGIALSRMGHFKEAINAFQNAIRLRPDYSKARYNLEVVMKQETALNK